MKKIPAWFVKMTKWLKDFSWPGKLSTAVILAILFLAVFAPYLSAYSHNTSTGAPLLPPGGEHLLGTDELGVDLWAQICYGARVSLLVGLGTAFLAALGGGLVGIVAGYWGEWPDKILMRLIDIMIVLPDFPLLIVLAAFWGPSLLHIIVVLALFSWVFPARITRSQVLALKEQSYIKSAETYGAGAWYLMWKHFLPEVFRWWR